MQSDHKLNKRNKLSTEVDDAFIDRPTGCDFYKILGIPRTATVAQINAAYNLAKAALEMVKLKSIIVISFIRLGKM